MDLNGLTDSAEVFTDGFPYLQTDLIYQWEESF